MKVTKFIHSCLLIEEDGKSLLIDPGNYTNESKVLNVFDLKSLDYLLITHEHADHMDISLIKEVIEKFPQVKIVSNNSVVKLLAKESVNVSTQPDQMIKIEEVNYQTRFVHSN